jgi:hypothetical protein
VTIFESNKSKMEPNKEKIIIENEVRGFCLECGIEGKFICYDDDDDEWICPRCEDGSWTDSDEEDIDEEEKDK